MSLNLEISAKEHGSKLKRALAIVGVALVLLVGALGGLTIVRSSYENKIRDLQNQIAESSVTIEEKDGQYARLMVQTDDLKDLLDKKDKQIQELDRTLRQNKEELLTANTLVVKWKKAFESAANAQQSDVPTPSKDPDHPEVIRKRVDFDKDFGPILVSGFTLTDPPEAYVKVRQQRPLKLSLFVSQAADGKWTSRAISDDENSEVDIAVAAVNPYLLERKWYEKISLSIELGGATGLLAGVGAGYEIGNFDVGPKFWVTYTGKVDTYVGLGLTWRPFQRNR